MINLSPQRISALHYISADLQYAQTEVIFAAHRDSAVTGLPPTSDEAKLRMIEVLSTRPDWVSKSRTKVVYSLSDMIATVEIIEGNLTLTVHELDDI